MSSTTNNSMNQYYNHAKWLFYHRWQKNSMNFKHVLEHQNLFLEQMQWIHHNKQLLETVLMAYYEKLTKLSFNIKLITIILPILTGNPAGKWSAIKSLSFAKWVLLIACNRIYERICLFVFFLNSTNPSYLCPYTTQSKWFWLMGKMAWVVDSEGPPGQ